MARSDDVSLLAGTLRTAQQRFEQGDLTAAERLYCEVLATAPGSAGALHGLAVVFHARGEFGSAADFAGRLAETLPVDPESHYLHGYMARVAGRPAVAVAAYRRALELKPDFVECYNNLGNALRDLKNLEEAEAAFRQAIRLKADHWNALNNLGNVLLAQGRLSEAESAYRDALNLVPDNPQVAANVANARMGRAAAAEAVELLREVVAAHPDDAEVGSNLLMGLNYVEGIERADLFSAHQAWGRRHRRLENDGPDPSWYSRDRDPERRLRVGYVSADFRAQSVAYFIEPVLAAHDRGVVSVHVFSLVNVPDTTTARLKGLADVWREVGGLSAAALADRIRADEIDILIDLSGHTAGNCLLAFARRAAPVQVTYLGYPNTTGLAAMGYRLSDRWADPEGAEQYCTERLVRLPKGFHCYRPPDDAPEVAELPASSRGCITFGSFNNLAKMTPGTIAAWSSILKAVAGARLYLKSKYFGDGSTRDRITRLFAAHGVEAERLVLAGYEIAVSSHLAHYNEIDIALDTFPYNGTTTTCEALWMGVPVITLSAGGHPGRVGESLLRNLDLGDLVATDVDAYVDLAVALAADRELLATLRSGLRERMQAAPLLDARGFAAALEDAYRGMWRVWCADDPSVATHGSQAAPSSAST